MATPEGPIAIQNLNVGDTVFDEYGNPIKVKAVYNNGRKEVVELLHRGKVQAESTLNHTWLTRNSSARRIKQEELRVEEFKRDTQIKRVELDCELGYSHEETAYALGALLGDGCSKQPGNIIQISSNSHHVPNKIASLFCGYAESPTSSNFTWKIRNPIGVEDFELYHKWCNNRYAHEKIADLDIIRTWNRQTLLAYVAGLIDTDGSVYVDQWDNLCIALEMQAKAVVESVRYAFLALWQTDLTLYKNDRDKYINGPTYTIRCANNAYSKRALKELDKHLVVPNKKYKTNYDELISKRTNPYWTGVKLGEKRIANTYDIHVDSPTNLYCLANGLVTHNSGKSQLAAREIAWVLTDTHPYWSRPARWGDEPLLIIIAGQDRKQMEIELWEKKLALYMDRNEWKETRMGQALQHVQNKKTGDRIVFVSHSDSSDKNRRHMQGYVAHYVWLDEMPSSIGILEELQRRVDARRGYLLATFTPKFRNDAIKRVIDAGEPPLAKKYTMSKLDNPLYRDRIQEELDKLEGYSESMKAAILYGEWYTGDSSVYEWMPEFMEKEPEAYSRAWRHCLSVDPALKSKFGFTLWAEEPRSGIWYLVRDEYIEGIYDPQKMHEEVEKRVTGYNLVRRISAPRS